MIIVEIRIILIKTIVDICFWPFKANNSFSFTWSLITSSCSLIRYSRSSLEYIWVSSLIALLLLKDEWSSMGNLRIGITEKYSWESVTWDKPCRNWFPHQVSPVPISVAFLYDYSVFLWLRVFRLYIYGVSERVKRHQVSHLNRWTIEDQEKSVNA